MNNSSEVDESSPPSKGVEKIDPLGLKQSAIITTFPIKQSSSLICNIGWHTSMFYSDSYNLEPPPNGIKIDDVLIVGK